MGDDGFGSGLAADLTGSFSLPWLPEVPPTTWWGFQMLPKTVVNDVSQSLPRDSRSLSLEFGQSTQRRCNLYDSQLECLFRGHTLAHLGRH